MSLATMQSLCSCSRRHGVFRSNETWDHDFCCVSAWLWVLCILLLHQVDLVPIWGHNVHLVMWTRVVMLLFYFFLQNYFKWFGTRMTKHSPVFHPRVEKLVPFVNIFCSRNGDCYIRINSHSWTIQISWTLESLQNYSLSLGAKYGQSVRPKSIPSSQQYHLYRYNVICDVLMYLQFYISVS